MKVPFVVTLRVPFRVAVPTTLIAPKLPFALPAGAADPQSPHTEDEVYHVIRGRATITVGHEEHPVTAGSIVFVGADVPHRFHDIEDELVVVVIFGPAEYTHRVDHERGQPHGAAPA